MKNASLFSRRFLVAVGLVLSVPALVTVLFGLQEDTGALPGLLRSDIIENQQEYRRSRRSSADLSEGREPTDAERRLLRAYSRAGYCSKAAGQYVYDLCRLQVKPQTRHGGAPMGVLNDNIQLHSASRVNIPLQEKLRARYMQTSETLREEFRGPRPMRYEGGLKH